MYLYVLSYNVRVRGSVKKYPDSKMFLYFRLSDLNKILAPAVFDYEESKSESWHSAKKIREVFLDNKSAPPLFFVIKNCCFISRSGCTRIKII